jgi:hypothetical protein
MAREIGFTHGAPKKLVTTWERLVSGTTFVYKKELVRAGLFQYNVACYGVECEYRGKRMSSSGSTGFISERDLSADEVERLPQFADFVASRP